LSNGWQRSSQQKQYLKAEEAVMSARSHTFTHAITRLPGAQHRGWSAGRRHGYAPDLETFLKHHADYVAALRSTGAEVTVLDALDDYPDSVFVEDAALCLQEGAIVMRPGAPTRLGEAALMRPTLERFYDEVLDVSAPATIEGGDILVCESEILVGTSARTNARGIAELGRLVERWGYKVRTVETPEGVLHFKTDCSLLDAETILATRRLAASGCFDGYRVIHVADGEEAAANTIRFNDLVLMPSGFPATRDALVDAGYNVREIGNCEAAKLDGGMSCLSLRFSPVG
jgi:dimethylargininase